MCVCVCVCVCVFGVCVCGGVEMCDVLISIRNKKMPWVLRDDYCVCVQHQVWLRAFCLCVCVCVCVWRGKHV